MAAREADGRREQLRERVSAGCVRPDGGGAGGGSSEAGRAYEGVDAPRRAWRCLRLRARGERAESVKKRFGARALNF